MPFRILTKEEEKLLDKHYGDIKKQIDDALGRRAEGFARRRGLAHRKPGGGNMTGAWCRATRLGLAAFAVAGLLVARPPGLVAGAAGRRGGRPRTPGRERAPAQPVPAASLYSLDRPDAAAGPTVVAMGGVFQDVASLSDVDQTLDTDVLVVARAGATRACRRHPARGEASVNSTSPEGRLWMPALEPENLRGRQAFYPARFLVDERGIATFARRLWGEPAPTRSTFVTFLSTSIAGGSRSGPSCRQTTRSSSTRWSA